MNEEEKKAIELLKQEPDFSLRYYERENAIDIVLNIIEKQDKIIDKMSERIEEESYWVFHDLECASKEEIKEYFMKEIENE